MKRLSDVVGMPVVCAKSGKTIGDVKEPVFTPNGSEVAGLLTLIRGNVNKTGIIFIEDILDIGKDAILIFDNNSIEEDKKVIKGFMKNNKWFCMNKKVLTKDGIANLHYLLGSLKIYVMAERYCNLARIQNLAKIIYWYQKEEKVMNNRADSLKKVVKGMLVGGLVSGVIVAAEMGSKPMKRNFSKMARKFKRTIGM